MIGTLGKQSNEKPCDTIDTLIGAKTEFQGDIAFCGGLRIDGKVKGNVTAQGAGNSTLILGERAEVHGTIEVPHLITNGRIEGDVHCAERMEVQSQAEILGDVHYKVLGISFGATIKGNLLQQSAENSGKGVITQLKPAAARGERKTTAVDPKKT